MKIVRWTLLVIPSYLSCAQKPSSSYFSLFPTHLTKKVAALAIRPNPLQRISQSGPFAQTLLHYLHIDHDPETARHFASFFAPRKKLKCLAHLNTPGAHAVFKSLCQTNTHNQEVTKNIFFDALFQKDLKVAQFIYCHQPTLIARMDRCGMTPLYTAASSHEPRMVRWLLWAGANPNAVDATQLTTMERILMWAYPSEQLQEIMRMLLHAGAYPKIPSLVQWGHSIVSRAIEAGDPLLVELALQKGSDPHETDAQGSTALIKALSSQHLCTEKLHISVAILADYGADLTHANEKGVTSLELIRHLLEQYPDNSSLRKSKKIIKRQQNKKVIDTLLAGILKKFTVSEK